jgi:hypothetical protein
MLVQSIFPVFLIFLILIIVVTLVYGTWTIYENKKKIDQNWSQYKCKPYIFPFAGWLVGPGTTNPGTNFRDCSWLIFKSFFDVLISPFVEILSIIVNILTNFTEDIQNLRKMVNFIRSSIRNIATDVYNKLKDTYYRLAYVYRSFMRVFSNIFKTMKFSFDSLMYTYYTLMSLWNGPIGGTARFFCFDENTPIEMEDGTFKLIKNVELNDITRGGKVLATYKFESDCQNMYILSDNKNHVIVSGSHPILEDGCWIRVENHSNAVPYPNIYPNKYIYCLHTSTSKIYTHLNKIVFGDYDELIDAKDNYTIFYNQIEHLNNSVNVFSTDSSKKFKFKEYINMHNAISNNHFKPYFDPLTPLYLLNGKMIYIKDIKVGDILLNDGRVLGISKLSTDSNTKVYKIDLGKINDLLPIYCTEGTIIKNIKNNIWNQVSRNIFSKLYPEYSKPIMYSILTESGTITINHLLFQDHDNNYNIQEEVDKFSIQRLNSIPPNF